MQDKAIAYQRKIEALYANEAANKFLEEFSPADPFDKGILINAADLEISELVKIYQAAKRLESGGHQPFTNNLILSRGVEKTPLVRVNPKCADSCRFVDRANRPKRIEICNLLHEFFFSELVKLLPRCGRQFSIKTIRNYRNNSGKSRNLCNLRQQN